MSRRGAYLPAYVWPQDRLEVLKQAIPDIGTTKPYKLARDIVARHGWDIDPKTVVNKIYWLLRADGRVREAPGWKDLYRDLWIEVHGERSTEVEWQMDAAARKDRLSQG